MKLQFTVIKSTESSKGGFVNTLETVKTTTVFGVAKTTKRRFLMKTDAALAEGQQEELELGNYNIVEFSNTVLDENNVEKVLTSSWLQDKIA
jgi:hypothetical protein